MNKLGLCGLAVLTVLSTPALAWNESHCQTAIGETRAQKGRILKHCIGKFSKEKYASIFVDYAKMNGTHIPGHSIPYQVDKVLHKAGMAIANPNVKWKSHKDQKHIDNAKLAASVIGGTIGGLTVVIGGSVLALSDPVFVAWAHGSLTSNGVTITAAF